MNAEIIFLEEQNLIANHRCIKRFFSIFILPAFYFIIFVKIAVYKLVLFKAYTNHKHLHIKLLQHSQYLKSKKTDIAKM